MHCDYTSSTEESYAIQPSFNSGSKYSFQNIFSSSFKMHNMLDYKLMMSHMVSCEFSKVYNRFEVCTWVAMYLYYSMLFGHVSLCSCMYLYSDLFTSHLCMY